MSEKYESTVIHSYTAAQAVEDGVLFDAQADLVNKAGFACPVRYSQMVEHELTSAEGERKERELELLKEAMLAVVQAAAMNPDSAVQDFACETVSPDTFWACIDGTSGMAIHIIHPEEY